MKKNTVNVQRSLYSRDGRYEDALGDRGQALERNQQRFLHRSKKTESKESILGSCLSLLIPLLLVLVIYAIS